MPTLSACRDEIESLHAFFVRWYAGTVGRDAFDRMEHALVPGFEMVTPDGVRRDRKAVLDGVYDAYGRDEPGTFDIEIRDVGMVREMDGHATVRYEEWQESDEGTTGRLSTALFRETADAPGGLAWLDLHETWIER